MTILGGGGLMPDLTEISRCYIGGLAFHVYTVNCIVLPDYIDIDRAGLVAEESANLLL